MMKNDLADFFPAAPDAAGTDDLASFFQATPAPPPVPRSPANIRIGGLKEAGKAVLQSGAEILDFLNPIPIAAHVGSYIANKRIQQEVGGTPHQVAKISKEAADDISMQLSGGFAKLVEALGLQPEDKTAVGSATEHVSEAISNYARHVGDVYQSSTGGAVQSEDVQEMINVGLLGLGVKGSAKLARKPAVEERPAVGTPPPVPESPKQRAARNVKADIEAATGITASSQAVGAAREARRAEARAAFREDPEYADYLKQYADEAAQARATNPPPLKPADDLASYFEPPNVAPDAAGAGRSVDPFNTGMGKLQAGKALDLTPEEGFALRGALRGGKQDFFSAAAALGLGTAAAVYAASDEGGRDTALASAGLLGLVALRGLPEATPLGAMLDKGGYTLKTLERLPQNRFELTREQVLQQLARQDVSKAEKEMVLAALGERQKISAKELVVGVREQMEPLELRKRETDTYADYGLPEIGRRQAESDMWVPEGRDPTEYAQEMAKVNEGVAPSRTTIYQSPLDLGDSNHFSDPNYFAHTRSFDENGIRHVVEVQSDVAQHYRPVTREKAEALENERQTLIPKQAQATFLSSGINRESFITGTEAFLRHYKEEPGFLDDLGMTMHDAKLKDLAPKDKPAAALEMYKTGSYEGPHTHPGAPRLWLETAFSQMARDLRLRGSEIEAALSARNASEIQPMIKDWYKRVIREEVKDAAQLVRKHKEAIEKDWPSPASQEPKPVVRFATADTVAKVEGWPQEAWENAKRDVDLFEKRKAFNEQYLSPEQAAKENKILEREVEEARRHLERPRFSPEHQSIYDRYKRDIEGFLTRELNGKPYTDAQGHTWIEVPFTEKHGGPVQMFGRADPKMLGKMAAIGLGAWAASQMDSDNPFGAGVLGGLLSAAAVNVKPGKAVAKIRELFSPDKRVSIAGLANLHDRGTRLAAIDVINLQKQIDKLVPDEKAQSKITTAVQANNPAGLTSKERQAYSIAHHYITSLHNLARVRGIQQAVADSQQRILAAMSGAAGRDSINVILGVESNALVRALENDQLIKSLRATPTPTGSKLVMPASKAPSSYVSYDSPLLAGQRVHPDIVPQLKFLLHSEEASAVGKALLAINDVSKRAAVSFSLFHAKALVDAYIGSQGPAALRHIPGIIDGSDGLLKELEAQGSTSKTIREAVDSGLMFSADRAPSAVEDVGQSFYKAMEYLQGVMDKSVPGGGKAVGAVIKANHVLDKYMWGRLHAGMKLNVWLGKRDQLLLNSQKAHVKNPNQRILSTAEAGEIAASYTNDLFGGLNWRRIAMDSGTKVGRLAGEFMFKPSSRRFMQLLMFAPDWTLSTTRAMIKAIDKDLLNPVRVAKGLVRPVSLADLHRQYVARSAVYYFIAGEALNLAFSGHHLWENKDWTMIDMGDGRRMQWSKHAMEPIHWFTKPVQQGLNKLGFFPKEILNQTFNTEYLAPRQDKHGNAVAGPPMKSSRVAHVAKSFQPIALQQAIGGDAGPENALAGFFGFPIYGMTEEQKRAAAEERRRKRLFPSSE